MTQLRQNPLDFSVLSALRQHCEATQSFAVWAEALEHHARAATDADGDPVELGRLHFELGSLYRNQLGRSDRALAHYRSAIDLDAAQRPALVAARAIAAENEDWPDVADLLMREADSLPAGAKRAAALVELGKVQSERLGQRDQAEGSLREAVSYVADDLQVHHELATLLLDNADAQRNTTVAARKRREAADVLSTMARAVSDDYAFAYIEAGLDAMPDHAESLELLETVAPRMGRSETLAPRWLTAIRATQNRELARSLRLKMAAAYVAVGQIQDARICLEPLLAEGDPEAHAMARRAQHADVSSPAETQRGSRAPRGSKPPPTPVPAAPEHEEELLSAEMLLEGEHEHDDDDDDHDELDLESLDGEEDERDSLAHELADLSEHTDEQDQAHDPLADLAMLDAPSRAPHEPSPALRELLDASELSDDLDSREELLDSGELAVSDSGLQDASALLEDAEEDRMPVPVDDEPVTAQLDDEPVTEQPVVRHSSMPPRLPPRSTQPRATLEPIQFQPPREDDDEHDPFAEETQPRATPLTLAELTALTGEDTGQMLLDRNIIMAPAGEPRERDPDSEVTQLTPAEDPQITELRSLRTELGKRLRFRDRRGAAEVAQTLLERGVFDADAIEALEEHFRLARDFKGLRDLSMRLANELSFPADVRGARLREAVTLSESKLGDQEGAATALRELLELEPEDNDAFEKLKKLLKRGQRWDELADLLEHRADEVADRTARAELLRELGALQRDKRSAIEPAISAFVRARECDPGRVEDELALSDLYVGSGRYAEAATMYEARIEKLEPAQRTQLLAALAQLYEEQLHDDERAQRTLESWRAIEPRKPEPLHALIRVLERRGQHEALVDALGEQLTLASPSERVRLHVRIAEVAFVRLGDAGRAADSYAEAIALAPQDTTLWRAAAPAFEQAGRGTELDEQLWGLAQGSRDRALSSSLFEYLAQTRATRADVPGAIQAREAQYGVTHEVPVLVALVALLRSADRPSDLSRRLDELARRSEPEAARALRLERADVLAHKLNEPEAAKAELERVLSELGPDDSNALRKLVELCIATGDVKRRASAQERLIKLAPSLSARVELAVELVEIYEHELNDAAGTARVLTLWTSLEPENPTPYMRLAPLLAQSGRKRELLDTLDKLTKLANSDEEAGEFLLRAARVAIEIEDFDGAWNRLVPRVVDGGDAAAERLLRELTRIAGRGEQLASLYVGLAQRSDDAEVEKRRWADAARVYEQELSAHDRALEAMLRALAKQLDNRELLGEVERLAGRAQAWPRLAQVYDTIVRRAESTEARIQLLMRHARLLETGAADSGTAFERVWLAFQLDPALDETYGEARRLAIATGRREELLGAYERRAQSAASRDARIEALLEACALAQHELEDTARATGYLSRAVALAGDGAQQLDSIEARVRSLDAEQPPITGRGLLAELTGVYTSLANENPRAPALASTWLARAARIHELKLDDPDAAFRSLERASMLAPSDISLLDELTRVAALGKNWESLAKHLQYAADVAIDSNSSSAALSRLGLLCERELASPSRAADAYEQLVRLRPKDADASRRLRACLRASERHDELLIAIDRELFMLKPEEGKRELLKQAAETWELGLKNRYEALDAWKKVAAIAPADPDAVAALARLRARPRADDSLLDEDVVVLPEDLRPSVVGMPASTLFSAANPTSASAINAAAASSDFLSDRSRGTLAAPQAPTEEMTPIGAASSALEDAPDAPEQALQATDADDDEPAQNDATIDLGALAARDEATLADVPDADPEPDADSAEPVHESGEFDAPSSASQDLQQLRELDQLIAGHAAEHPIDQVLATDDVGEDDEPADAIADEVTNAAPLDLSEELDNELDDDLSDELDNELSDEIEIQPIEPLTHSGSIDLSDSLQDYDADVTLPLERGEELHQRASSVSLEGLSSLLTRTPTPPPPPPTKRNSSRIPPPPPRAAAKPPEDE